MARPRKEFYVELKDRRGGRERYRLVVGQRRYSLESETKAEAEVEGAALYRQMQADQKVVKVSPGPHQPALTPQPGTLRAAISAYFESVHFDGYKPLTVKGQRSTFNLIMRQPAAPPNRNVLGDSLLSEWLAPGGEGGDAVLRVMGACGNKVAAANKRLVTLSTLFGWLLGKDPDAAEARATFKVSRAAKNPCLGIEKPKRRRDGKRHGHLAFTDDHVGDWLAASKDDPEQHRAVRLMQIIGPRVSDLHRLNRGMIKNTPYGRVLTFKQEKGSGSLYRDGEPPDIVIPYVPELQAIIDELPADRLCFIHSTWDLPFKSPASMSMKVRKWRKDCGLPEGLSAHGMRKSATHWWLRNYRDLIGNDFSLKTIFGWITDKELDRYTKDFNRQAEAEGMLIKLSDRRVKVSP